MTLWTPFSEPTLALYFDGNQFNASTHGTAIASWTDQKNANNATQGTSGLRPTVDVTTGLNGEAVVNFDVSGSGQLLALPDCMSGFVAGSVFFIAKDVADPPTVSDGHPFSC